MASQSDATAILSQFEALQSKQSRNEVVDRLPDLLRADEWRVLKGHLNAELFQRDILGSLPIEIVSLIVENLDLSEIVLFQRVCKQWQFLLSSTAVQSAALNRRCHTKVQLEPSQVHCALRRRIMLERGQPYSVISGSNPSLRTEGSEPIVDYSSGRFAWLDMLNGRRIVLVQDFQLEIVQRFCSEDREPFVQVRVSQELVAAVSARGYCHVWDRAQTTACFRLPSMQFGFFVLGGQTVALSFEGSLLLWDFKSRRSSVLGLQSKASLIALNHQGDRLTVVHPQEGRDQNGKWWIEPTLRTYALNLGADTPFQESSTFTRKIQFAHTDWGSVSLDHSPSLTSDLNQKGIAILAECPTRLYYLLIHDREASLLWFRVVRCEPGLQNSISSIGFNLLAQLATVNSNRRVEVLSRSSDRVTSKSMGVVESRIASPNLLFGDGQFVVMVNGNELTAWSLDDTRQPRRANPVMPLFD